MKYKWSSRAVCEYYHEIETGKIVATISKTSFSDDTWFARINGDNLGEFISAQHSKKAVEKFVKEMDMKSYETKTFAPEGLIDPKSYYEGYEDGKAEIL